MTRERMDAGGDDLDGSKAVETVAFAVDGTWYEIDLSTRDAAAFRSALSRYIDAARTIPDRVDSRRRTAAKKGNGTPRRAAYERADLRKWAAANDVHVASRGRVPQAVVDRYLARNS